MIYNISRNFSNFTSWFFPHFVKRAYFTAFHPKLFCYFNIATEIHNVMCIANVLLQYTSWCSSLFLQNLWDTVSAEVLRALALLLILSRSPSLRLVFYLVRLQKLSSTTTDANEVVVVASRQQRQKNARGQINTLKKKLKWIPLSISKFFSGFCDTKKIVKFLNEKILKKSINWKS